MPKAGKSLILIAFLLSFLARFNGAFRLQQNAAGPTTRIVDCYKSGVVDVNKEISMISDDSVEECPFSETSPSGTTWVLKTRVIEKNTHHFFNAKFSEIARRFQKCKL